MTGSRTRSKGITASFATSGYTLSIVDVDPGGASVDDLDATDQSCSDGKEFEPGSFPDHGEVTLKVWHNPSVIPVVGAAREQITVTFPVPIGSVLTNPPTKVFSGYLKSYVPTGPLGQLMTANIVLKIARKPVYTAAS